MAKLTVKNVGPIREAEIEVKKHTVFIGPQGSGKSTLAKLIAIGGDADILLGEHHWGYHISPKKYNMDGYLAPMNSSFTFDIEDQYSIEYQESGIKEIGKEFYIKQKESEPFLRDISPAITSYIPAERSLFPALSDAIWSLADASINLPRCLTVFGKYFEQARNEQNQLQIPFLNIRYSRENGRDLVYYELNKAINLAQSASGYQSVIPLLMVIEHQRQQSQRRFIIEEPELSLYPTAQKDLIYNLMSGLQPDVEYQDAKWVITTHSPYVLSSFNTLMLAYKVAQRSEELRAEVEKIIPARCWINPDEFAAYYVDNGTVRSIISEQTGLIADNELDDVSEDLAGEQDQLFDLSRSVPRA